jgi:glutathione S-transferase
MTAVLWHLELSHYSEKVRWALDYKRIPHVRRTPTPGVHGLFAMALTRSTHRRLPLLDLDGRRIVDSTAIIAALEEYRPDPPLYPADPVSLTRALELEDHFDEVLAPAVRVIFWHERIGSAGAAADALGTRASSARRRMLRAGLPLVRPFVTRDYGIGAESAAEAVETVRRVMDRIEDELQPGGYLVGEGFTVADLSGAALFTPLLAPPGRPYMPPDGMPALRALREELGARPGGRWVDEMYVRHRRADTISRQA